MKFSDFIIADIYAQNHAISTAVHVTDIIEEDGIRKLFQLHEFYIEKCFDTCMVFTQLNAFENDSVLLDPYLDQISIDKIIG